MADGKRHWVIPDAYIPPHSSGSLPSHEAICVLNCGGEEAALSITAYFEDREPLENMQVTVGARRTKHIRTDELHKDGESIPPGVPYALEVFSNVPIYVQYSRLDSTQPELALMTTMAYPVS